MPHGDIDPDLEGDLEDDLDDDTDPQHLLHADQAAYFDGLSDLEDTSSSSSATSSDSESMPNARLYAPPADSVGWTPCDVALHVAPDVETAEDPHGTVGECRRALIETRVRHGAGRHRLDERGLERVGFTGGWLDERP